tara:strand:+ start:496 stop:1242 length:747 start_codon:yes stop_codon:yes gene_type:complete
MTIEKTKLHIVDSKNNKKSNQLYKKHTMALLKKLLDEKGSSQLQLANTLGRDKTTVNRWVKNSREISWENAEKIATVLGCHPVEIYQPSVFVTLDKKCSWDGLTKDIPKSEHTKIKIPFEFYNEQVKAVQMDSPGTPSDGEIWLFDIQKNKKIDKNCVNQICYVTASASFKKNNHHKLETNEVIGKTKCWHPLIALLKGCGNGKLQIVNSYTNKLLNPLCDNLTYDDFEIAAPVKAKYAPELIIKHSK